MRVLTCLTDEHHLGLVALAALICLLGSFITTGLLKRVRENAGMARLSWLFLGAVAGGATIWCTHFVAMIAYRPGVETAYEPLLTGASLAVAILGVGLALAAASMRRRFSVEAGGILFGAAVAAMHFVGMAALSVEGVVHWSAVYLAVSVAGSVLFGALSFHLASADDRYARLKGGAAMVLGIVCLHFTAMAAMTVIPLAPLDGMLTGENARDVLALGVAGVGLLVLGAGAASHALDREALAQNRERL